MIDFGAVFPVAHEQLAVLVAPETDVLPRLLDFLDVFDLLLFLLDGVLAAVDPLALLQLFPGWLLANEARAVFGTAQADLQKEQIQNITNIASEVLFCPLLYLVGWRGKSLSVFTPVK